MRYARSPTEGATEFPRPSFSDFLLDEEPGYLKRAVDSRVKPTAAVVD